MAPIFDSGSSMGYDRMAARITNDKDTVCKPFKKQHEEQLKLVSSFDWIDFDALADIGDFIRSTFGGDAVDFVGADRAAVIAQTVEKRIHTLHEFALTWRPVEVMDTVDGDVEENIAEDYTPKMTM